MARPKLRPSEFDPERKVRRLLAALPENDEVFKTAWVVNELGGGQSIEYQLNPSNRAHPAIIRARSHLATYFRSHISAGGPDAALAALTREHAYFCPHLQKRNSFPTAFGSARNEPRQEAIKHQELIAETIKHLPSLKAALRFANENSAPASDLLGQRTERVQVSVAAKTAGKSEKDYILQVLPNMLPIFFDAAQSEIPTVGGHAKVVAFDAVAELTGQSNFITPAVVRYSMIVPPLLEMFEDPTGAFEHPSFWLARELCPEVSALKAVVTWGSWAFLNPTTLAAFVAATDRERGELRDLITPDEEVDVPAIGRKQGSTRVDYDGLLATYRKERKRVERERGVLRGTEKAVEENLAGLTGKKPLTIRSQVNRAIGRRSGNKLSS